MEIDKLFYDADETRRRVIFSLDNQFIFIFPRTTKWCSHYYATMIVSRCTSPYTLYHCVDDKTGRRVCYPFDTKDRSHINRGVRTDSSPDGEKSSDGGRKEVVGAPKCL